MAREICILRKLKHPNVIKLEGIVTSPASENLYLVFEYMEHDLVGLAATPDFKFTESQVIMITFSTNISMGIHDMNFNYFLRIPSRSSA